MAKAAHVAWGAPRGLWAKAALRAGGCFPQGGAGGPGPPETLILVQKQKEEPGRPWDMEHDSLGARGKHARPCRGRRCWLRPHSAGPRGGDSPPGSAPSTARDGGLLPSLCTGARLRPARASAWAPGPQGRSRRPRRRPHLHLDGNHHGDELLLQLLEHHQLLQGQAAQPARGTDRLGKALLCSGPSLRLPAPGTLVAHRDAREPLPRPGQAHPQGPCTRGPSAPRLVDQSPSAGVLEGSQSGLGGSKDSGRGGGGRQDT